METHFDKKFWNKIINNNNSKDKLDLNKIMRTSISFYQINEFYMPDNVANYLDTFFFLQIVVHIIIFA